MFMNRTRTDGQERRIAGGMRIQLARGSGPGTKSEWAPLRGQGRKRPGVAIPVAFEMEEPWASRVLPGRLN